MTELVQVVRPRIWLPQSAIDDIREARTHEKQIAITREWQRQQKVFDDERAWWSVVQRRPLGYEGGKTIAIIQLIESGDPAAAGEYAKEVATHVYDCEMDRHLDEWTGCHYFYEGCDCEGCDCDY